MESSHLKTLPEKPSVGAADGVNKDPLRTPAENAVVERLKPLFAPLETLPGVGTRTKLFKKLLGNRVVDALLHLPSNIQLYRTIQHMSEAREGETVTISAQVTSHSPAQRSGTPHKVSCYDGRGFFDLYYFRGQSGYIQKILPVKSQRVIIGKAEKYNDRWKISHPEKIMVDSPQSQVPARQIIYPLTNGITSPCVGRVITAGLSRLPSVPDWIPSPLKEHYKWSSWRESLCRVHEPQHVEDINPHFNKFRERLIYDELFAHQLALHLVRRHSLQNRAGKSQVGTGDLMGKLLSILPYAPTKAQQRVIGEILGDMAQPVIMSRLVQGDVGCGKTLVAMIALLRAVESNCQGAILAPTDILARQHGQTMISLFEQLGVKAALLTARETGKKRTKILADLADGTIQILIGTHAIIESAVQFKNLGLAVIDEQHRFGVEQRLKLSEKGDRPDLLAMTATPIPRTLQLANYGDMDVSIIDEKPAGRQPVQTKVLPITRLDDVIKGVQRALETGAKAFWVCPLVEESEVMDLAAVEQRFLILEGIFGGRVGLVHGKMKAADKDEMMEKFIHGNVDILVATTVIEVGVNVPAATIMLIEQAERFGLAQLHQLRGRIGRGDQSATCLLLYKAPLSLNGQRRLEIMRETDDGFKIAEADLKLRGGGDVLGTRQSGLPGFRLADFVTNSDKAKELLSLANKEAKRVCKEDPFLTGENSLSLRLLLSVFNKDEAIKYTRS